ncbi:MAG: efflux RND transporter permease subunit [Alistipes sp.]|nr:efflux RND transporter permease subunit [Alistipes sp.]
MANITKISVANRSIVWFFLVMIILGGIYAFEVLGKKEDSTFKIKSAVVVCPYSGATPEQVERLVVEPLERELRTLTSVKKITSEAHFGYARLVVELKSATPADRVEQLWDELRRKVDNVTPSLPEGAGPITVADDFGDVYGMYYAVVADEGYSWEELRDYAQRLQMQLYTVSGVEKVVLWGEQQPKVDIVISTATLAAFDLRPDAIERAISSQSAIVNVGEWSDGELYVTIVEDGTYSSLSDIENQLLMAADGKQYRLGDVARVERSYVEPSQTKMWVDNRRAIGVAVASDADMDIVAVGDEVEAVIERLSSSLPVGVDIETIYPENRIAREATNDFLINLIESLAIVILLVMVAMGWRSGVVVGMSLILSIAATFIVMLLLGEGLNRTSLAGFIIAMGMLVDNAIVVSDNMQMLSRRGLRMERAATIGATSPRIALLTATLIAIISFLPLQLAPSSVAEIIRPLFFVIMVSLLASWLLALTQVPAMGVVLLRTPKCDDGGDRSMWFGGVVRRLIRYRWLTICAVVAIFALSLWVMSAMPQNFFPQLSKPYFRADMLLPEGYDMAVTERRLHDMSEWLDEQPEVKRVSTVAGGTPPRYYLASGSYALRPNYGNILVELRDADDAAVVEERFDRWVEASFADVWLRSSLFKLSPVPDATIEFGFVGDNIDTLARLTNSAMDIMRRSEATRNVRNSWGNRVAVWQPHYSQLKGQRIGVYRGAMLQALEVATDGLRVGSYRDGDVTMPIVLRSTSIVDSSLNSLITTPVFSSRGGLYSLAQAISSQRLSFDNAVIKRINSERVMKAQCDPARGVNTIALLDELRNDIESQIALPVGYRMELFGEEESRDESNAALVDNIPLTLLAIFVLLLLLFRSYRGAIAVMITVPLIFIGVVLGLGVTGKMFDFFSLLGLLGLVGMNIKSGVILLTRIDEMRASGLSVDEAAWRAAADRFTPVVVASLTTVLGMVPLLFDSMFGGMAATIMGGLVVATLLVLLVLPVIYSLLYGLRQ